jgi:outer membrane protein assembly factor BamB
MLLLITLIGAGCTSALSRGVAQGWAGGVVVDDTIIVGSRGGKIMALDATDGSLQGDPVVLTVQLPSRAFGCGGSGTSGVAIYSSPVINENLVYIGGYTSGKVYAFLFDGESLTTESEYDFPREGDLGGAIVGELAIDQEGNVYFGCANGKVYALDATLRSIWDYDTGDAIWSSPAITEDTLFIGNFGKKLCAIDISDGTERWAFETRGAIIATPLVNEDKVYFGTFGRRFYAVDITSGEEVWRFPEEDNDEVRPQNWFWAKPLVSNGTIYAPNMDGKVYALDAETGTLTNRFDLGGAIVSSPVLIDGLIIVATQEGDVYSLNTVNNEQKLLASLDEKVQAPLFASNDTVYVHTFEDNLYAIDVQTGTSQKFSLSTDTSE